MELIMEHTLRTIAAKADGKGVVGVHQVLKYFIESIWQHRFYHLKLYMMLYLLRLNTLKRSQLICMQILVRSNISVWGQR